MHPCTQPSKLIKNRFVLQTIHKKIPLLFFSPRSKKLNQFFCVISANIEYNFCVNYNTNRATAKNKFNFSPSLKHSWIALRWRRLCSHLVKGNLDKSHPRKPSRYSRADRNFRRCQQYRLLRECRRWRKRTRIYDSWRIARAVRWRWRRAALSFHLRPRTPNPTTKPQM